MKHPRYVAIHLLRSQASPRSFVEILRAGEEWELLTYFPELEAEYGPIRAAYNALADELDADFARLKDAPDQKAFAQAAQKTCCSPALFAMRAGHSANARDFLGRRAHLSLVLRLLGLKDEPDAPNALV